MTVLVTGGAGFIGSHLVRRLLRDGTHTVVNVDKLTYAGTLESLGDVANNPKHIFARVDICDAAALRNLFVWHAPDAVIHLAAESHVDRSIDGPGEFIRTNISGTYELLQAARGWWEQLRGTARDKFRFVHISTDEVFGSLALDDPPFSETTRYDPRSPYSASKAGADHLVRAWHHTFGLPAIVTNCSNNYGPFQFPEKLIPVVILKALRGEPIPVYGTGENIRDWIYVEDHADALVQVLERGRVGETYAIGGDNEQRNIDLVRKICRLLDEISSRPHRYEELITFVPDRPGHDLRYAINSAKIRTELGWSAREQGDTGLRKTVQWYVENAKWWQGILAGRYDLERLGLGGVQSNA